MSIFHSELKDCRTPGAVARVTLQHARHIADTQLGNVQFADWKRGYMEIVAQHGFSDKFLNCFRRVDHMSGSACGRALFARASILIEDVMEDYQFRPYRKVAENAGFRSVQSTPLVSSGGELWGIVSTHNGKVGKPTHHTLKALEHLATKAADRLAQLRSEANFVRNKRLLEIEKRLQAMSWVPALQAGGIFVGDGDAYDGTVPFR